MPLSPLEEDRLFGRILVQLNLARADDVDRGLDEAARRQAAGETVRLGPLLIRQGSLSPEQLHATLRGTPCASLVCPGCGRLVERLASAAGPAPPCPDCGVALVVPGLADTLSTLAVPPAAAAVPPQPGPLTPATHVTSSPPPPPAFPLPPPLRPVPADAGGGPAPSRVLGRYRLLLELGAGGMGTVWKAWDTELRRVVALKLLNSRRTTDDRAGARFLREARLAAKLRHPAIVAVYDAGVAGDELYITMDFIEGRTFAARLEDTCAARRSGSRAGSDRLREEVALLADVAEAVAYAHGQGVIHRDLKPANVLLDAQGRPFVADFGLAKEVRRDGAPARAGTATEETLQGQLLGTPGYMSPEQAAGDPDRIGPATDVWALGVMLFEILTGQLPFESGQPWQTIWRTVQQDVPAPRARARHAPRELEAVCLAALEKPPERRLAGAAELAAELRRWLRGEPVHTKARGPAYRAWRWAARHRGAVAAGVAACALVLGALAWGWRERGEADRRTADALATRARQQLGAARTAEAAGQTVHALSAFSAALELAPGDPEARAGVERLRARLADDEKQAGNLLEQARRALDQAAQLRYDPEATYETISTRADRARTLIDQALAKAPGLATGHFLRGRAWELKGWPDNAESSWREALRIDERFAVARFALGHLLLGRAYLAKTAGAPLPARQLAREAETEIAAALGDAGGLDDPLQRYLAAAMVAFTHDDAVEVRRICRAALHDDLTKGRGYEEFHWLLGTASAGVEALAAFDRAVAACPCFALAYYSRARARFDAGDLKRALADYDRALAANPRFAAGYRDRSFVRSHAGELQGTVSDYEQALKLDPRLALGYHQRADAQPFEGDLAGDVESWSRALHAAPRSAAGWYNRGNAHLRTGDLAAALADYDQALALDPRYAQARTNRGLVRHTKGDLAGAITEYDAAIAMSPTLAAAHFLRGLALDQRGDATAARAAYDQALRLDPRYAEVLVQRGLLRFSAGDLAGAITDYTAALTLRPDLRAVHLTRGLARYRKGDWLGGISDFGRALNLK